MELWILFFVLLFALIILIVPVPIQSERSNDRYRRPSSPRSSRYQVNFLRYQGIEWERGYTPLSTLSRDEFQKRLGCNSRKTRQQRLIASQRNLVEYRAVASQLRDLRDASVLVDYRGSGFSSPVTDQGRCGSCVAHGCTNAVNATVKKREKNSSLDIRLSPADLFFCKGAREGARCDTGWFVDSGLYAMRRGIVSEDVYPYNLDNQSCPISGDSQALVKVGFIQSFERQAIQRAQRWIDEHGAIATSMLVFADFKDYKGGIYQPLADDPDSDFLGFHCVDIEGYDLQTEAWLGKNSWGTDWGDNGYFWIPFSRCGIDSEMFGIGNYKLLQPSVHQRTTLITKPSNPGCRCKN